MVHKPDPDERVAPCPTFVTNDYGLVAVTLTDNEHVVLQVLWEAPKGVALSPEASISLWRAARKYFTEKS